MDCIINVFQSSPFPHHISINSNSLFSHSKSVGLGGTVNGNRPWKLTTCWAIGLSGDNNNISHDNTIFKNENLNGSLFDDDESSPALFGTVEAEITQETIDFFVSDAEGDPDRPSPGYSSIEQALAALRQEKVGLCIFMTWKSSNFLFDC